MAEDDPVEHDAHAWRDLGHGEVDACGPVVSADDLLVMWSEARNELERLESQLAVMGVPLPEEEVES